MRISDWSSDVCSSDLIEGLAGGSAVGGEADLLDLRLGFAQLGIAVALQRGAAVVVADGAVQRALALLQLADDRLQLVERLFERHRADIGGNGVVCHGSCFRCGLFCGPCKPSGLQQRPRSEEHTSELQSLMRNSY